MSGGTISKARQRVLEVQARRGELRLARERGELFDARLAMQAWSSMVATFRSRMLAMPRALAEELAREAERGPAAIEAALMRAIHEALEALAGWMPPGPVAAHDHGAARAATKPNPRRGATTR